ncbi:MAG TPA: hypothetical protein PKM73_03740 [Verrucomicrobiota bacterium]|nr:hypothetical protein [Verrucomicrobiota bacterium]HNU50827.1 hypothetical protein [Verrucomicrobiota bacterium]
MNCPVCPARDLPDDCTCCPVCRADLQPFQRVRQLHRAQLAEAQRLFELGAVDPALHHAAAALALNPSYAPALKLLGRLFWQKGAAQEALARWEEAARLDPDDQEVQALLRESRAELQARDHRRKRAWWLGGAALGAALIAAVLYALLYVNPRLADRQGSSSTAAAGRPGAGTAETAVAKALEDLAVRLEALQRRCDTLAESQEPMTAQLNSTADAGAESRRQIAMLNTNLSEVSALATHLASVRLPDLSKVVTSTLDRLKAVESGLQTVVAAQAMADADAKTMLQTAAESQQALRNTRQEIAALEHWLAGVAQTAAPLLQPPAIEELAAQIAAARNELDRLQQEEARPRHSRGAFEAMADLRAESRVRAAQKRLAVLEAEWQKHAEPWLRFKTFLSTNAQPPAPGLSPR